MSKFRWLDPQQALAHRGGAEPGAASQGRGKFGRLDELTHIQNDFEDELARTGRHSRDRDRLSRDLGMVKAARHDETSRLLDTDVSEGDIRARLDQVDRNRNR